MGERKISNRGKNQTSILNLIELPDTIFHNVTIYIVKCCSLEVDTRLCYCIEICTMLPLNSGIVTLSG